jgi:hypothetical protein
MANMLVFFCECVFIYIIFHVMFTKTCNGLVNGNLFFVNIVISRLGFNRNLCKYSDFKIWV